MGQPSNYRQGNARRAIKSPISRTNRLPAQRLLLCYLCNINTNVNVNNNSILVWIRHGIIHPTKSDPSTTLTNNNSSSTKWEKMTPRYAHPRRLPAAHRKGQD
ncbi:hypothetical protein J3F84DRAFT_375020 [Trichoderma pleuroticola]